MKQHAEFGMNLVFYVKCKLHFKVETLLYLFLVEEVDNKINAFCPVLLQLLHWSRFVI